MQGDSGGSAENMPTQPSGSAPEGPTLLSPVATGIDAAVSLAGALTTPPAEKLLNQIGIGEGQQPKPHTILTKLASAELPEPLMGTGLETKALPRPPTESIFPDHTPPPIDSPLPTDRLSSPIEVGRLYTGGDGIQWNYPYFVEAQTLSPNDFVVTDPISGAQMDIRNFRVSPHFQERMLQDKGYQEALAAYTDAIASGAPDSQIQTLSQNLYNEMMRAAGEKQEARWGKPQCKHGVPIGEHCEACAQEGRNGVDTS